MGFRNTFLVNISHSPKLILEQGIIFVLFLSGPSFAADLSFQSETILRIFESDVREKGDDDDD
jgi:hypothetical protein